MSYINPKITKKNTDKLLEGIPTNFHFQIKHLDAVVTKKNGKKQNANP